MKCRRVVSTLALAASAAHPATATLHGSGGHAGDGGSDGGRDEDGRGKDSNDRDDRDDAAA